MVPMSAHPMTAEAKHRVRDALIALLRRQLEASRAAVAAEHNVGDRDPDSSWSVDDLAQSDAADMLAALFEEHRDQFEAEVTRIEAMDFSPTDTVRPGAVVAFGGQHYVVGAVAEPFDCDGTTYEGISLESPIYPHLAGLAAGQSFRFNGRERTLDVVA